MSLRGKNITVLGAGIAGLASAIALARRGARVTVVERAPELGEVGAAIQVTPNGQAVLAALGLGDRFGKIATPLSQLNIRDYRRTGVLATVDLTRQARAGGHGYGAVHRADLIALLAAAASRLGVSILTGREVTGIAIGFDQVMLPMAGGSQRSTRILVGADGIRSQARTALNPRLKPAFSGQVAWRALVDTRYVPIYDPPKLVDLYLAPGRHLVTYPVRGGRYLNIVAVEARKSWDHGKTNVPGDMTRFLSAFTGWPHALTNLLGLAENLREWGLFSCPVATDWGRSGIVLVGDALHPMLPFQAQGANMALEDAWVLAEALDANDDLQAGIDAFRKARERRVCAVVAASRGNARIYHASNPVKRAAIRAGLGAFRGWAPERLSRRFDWIYDTDVTGGADPSGGQVDPDGNMV